MLHHALPLNLLTSSCDRAGEVIPGERRSRSQRVSPFSGVNLRNAVDENKSTEEEGEAGLKQEREKGG